MPKKNYGNSKKRLLISNRTNGANINPDCYGCIHRNMLRGYTTSDRCIYCNDAELKETK